jgi:predicted amidohydrolase
MWRFRAAAVQAGSEAGATARNLERCVALLREAGATGAKLVAFPECMNAGSLHDDPKQAWTWATEIPGPFTEELGKVAAQLRTYVAIGLSERGQGGRVYDSAVFIGSDGKLLGKHQKQFLDPLDRRWCSAGATGYQVFETPIGKVGLSISGEGRLPEGCRVMSLLGAEILVSCSSWTSRDHYLLHVPVRSVENEAWTVAAHKPGSERGLVFPGRSAIIGPDGKYQVWGSEAKEEIVYGSIDLDLVQEVRARPDSAMGNRRPETYGLLARRVESLPLGRLLRQSAVPQSLGVTVATVQVSPTGGDTDACLHRALGMADDAGRLGTQFVVFPALFPYVLPLGPREARLAAERTPKLLKAFGAKAKAWGTYLALQLVEPAGRHLYCTCYLVSPTGGVAGKYRQVHLLPAERAWATPGASYPLFPTRYGRVGLMAGFDLRFFEVARISACQGADLILAPVAWRDEADERWLGPGRGLENRVFVVAANRVDAPIRGRSKVFDPRGAVIAEAREEREEIATAYLNLAQARDKHLGPGTDLFHQRRPELYGPLARRPG